MAKGSNEPVDGARRARSRVEGTACEEVGKWAIWIFIREISAMVGGTYTRGRCSLRQARSGFGGEEMDAA